MSKRTRTILDAVTRKEKVTPEDIEERQKIDKKTFRKILKHCHQAEKHLVKAQTQSNYVSRFDHRETDLITKSGVKLIQELTKELKVRFQNKVIGAYEDWTKKEK